MLAELKCSFPLRTRRAACGRPIGYADPVGADLLDEHADVQGSEWRLLRWLDDHCVATAQSRRHLPHEHQQGEIPLQRHEKNRGEKKTHHTNILAHTVKTNGPMTTRKKTTFRAQAVTQTLVKHCPDV